MEYYWKGLLESLTLNHDKVGVGEDIEGGLRKFLVTRKGGALKKLGGAPKICLLQNQQEGGLLKNLNHERGGC